MNFDETLNQISVITLHAKITAIMEHHELVQEMPSIERMATQDRLKHARKRRSTQLKKWLQYDKNWDKESSKKKKKQETERPLSQRSNRKKKTERVRFIANIALLESAARNDIDEGIDMVYLLFLVIMSDNNFHFISFC